MGEYHARSIDFPLPSSCLILCAACLYGACLPLRYLHVRRPTKPICYLCPFRAWSFFLSVTKAPCRLWRRPPNWPKDSLKGGAKRGINAPTLAADATTTDEDIARSVDELLGPGWKRSAGFDSSRPHIPVMVWETTGWHKRFYALASWDEVSVSTEGHPYRPIQSVFSRH